METDARKQATHDWKDRTPAAGIYSLTCLATGQVWVGQSKDLDKIANRLRFTLANPSFGNRDLVAAARAHDADSFQFDTLEALPEDTPSFAQARLLKERLAQWKEALGADTI